MFLSPFTRQHLDCLNSIFGFRPKIALCDRAFFLALSAIALFFAGPRLGLFAMLLGQDARRGHIGYSRLQFVFPAAHNTAFALHHGGETGPGDLCRIVLFLLPNLGIEHVGTFEERSFSCARHQACDRYFSVLQFIPHANEKELRNALVPL
jgi:hypothetical protein